MSHQASQNDNTNGPFGNLGVAGEGKLIHVTTWIYSVRKRFILGMNPIIIICYAWCIRQVGPILNQKISLCKTSELYSSSRNRSKGFLPVMNYRIIKAHNQRYVFDVEPCYVLVWCQDSIYRTFELSVYSQNLNLYILRASSRGVVNILVWSKITRIIYESFAYFSSFN